MMNESATFFNWTYQKEIIFSDYNVVIAQTIAASLPRANYIRYISNVSVPSSVSMLSLQDQRMGFFETSTVLILMLIAGSLQQDSNVTTEAPESKYLESAKSINWG